MTSSKFCCEWLVHTKTVLEIIGDCGRGDKARIGNQGAGGKAELADSSQNLVGLLYAVAGSWGESRATGQGYPDGLDWLWGC